MKKLSILTLLLLMATFAFANNNEPETNEVKNTNEVETISQPEERPSIIYYGERSGLFKPCVGHAITICKKIIFSAEKDKAYVTDGESTIEVNISQINIEDGSIM